jgi:glycosyltransferase involved in cell wall biosynthesis
MGKNSNIELSIVVICYNMQREILRTIASVLPPYQQGIKSENLEIIVIDNGSDKTPDLGIYKDKVKFISYNSTNHSPVNAINHGIKIAAAEIIGVFIDGARMATPGMCRNVLNVSNMHERVVISTLAFHLGPDVQMNTVYKGYDAQVEDKILAELDWQNNGYDLFLAGSLALSSKNGLLGSISESNAIFMHKELWHELDGYEPQFKGLGGGLANLDIYKRAGELDNTILIRLANEATFHQVHSGVATNHRVGENGETFRKEYETIRKMPFSPCKKIPYIYGKIIPQVRYFFAEDKKDADFINFNALQRRLNNMLRLETDGLSFRNQTSNKTGIKELLDSPVIIIGRGGSGTRLLSELVQQSGLFLGNELNETGDSIEWVEGIYDLVINNKTLEQGRFNTNEIDSLRLNGLKILKIKGIEKINLWGFKLPETMLCIAELKQAFPQARFIHLLRHPISISLRRSHLTSRLNNHIGQAVLKRAYAQMQVDFNMAPTATDEINNAISWYYQLEKVITFSKSQLNPTNYITVKYEDICENSEKVRKELYRFLDLDFNGSEAIDLQIDANRINKFDADNESLTAVWKICKPIAKKLGYAKKDVMND